MCTPYSYCSDSFTSLLLLLRGLLSLISGPVPLEIKYEPIARTALFGGSITSNCILSNGLLFRFSGTVRPNKLLGSNKTRFERQGTFFLRAAK